MRVVFVSGRFNVLHPGHIRFLQFARECGDRLVVGVERDAIAGANSFVPENLRLESVLSCSYVDEAFLMCDSVDATIRRLKPEVVVKGSEHENRENPEAVAVGSYGGRLIFSSGEIIFSSRDLLNSEFGATAADVELPEKFMSRHGILSSRLRTIVSRFSEIPVLVAGDLIVDEYISCDPLGMSQEDPTIVVKPLDMHRFVGGAGIVAAHAAALGAPAQLFSVVGDDEEARFAASRLSSYRVEARLIEDTTRPTTLKTRYRANGKTLFRVSRLHQASISASLRAVVRSCVHDLRESPKLVIFSDFNYGFLPQDLVNELTDHFRAAGSTLCADSQSSSQLGDVARFKNMTLLTPTEREARLSTRNREDGLSVLGDSLRSVTNSQNIILKLGQDGALVCPAPFDGVPVQPDRIEALNSAPKDVSGAGDSMLITAGLTLAAGGNIWEAACLGSVAAAIQVARVGNVPITSGEINAVLERS